MHRPFTASGLAVNDRGAPLGTGIVELRLREIHNFNPGLGVLKCIDFVTGEVDSRLCTYGPEQTHLFSVRNDTLHYRGHAATV